MVVGLLRDVFFSARIRETARQLGVPCVIVRDPAALATHAAVATLVVVDMETAGVDTAGAVRALKADPATRAVPVVGYLFDTHDALIAAARAAGCDQVLSRGGLTRKLPDLIAGRKLAPS
jgi:CheY-like chemotaxis protein